MRHIKFLGVYLVVEMAELNNVILFSHSQAQADVMYVNLIKLLLMWPLKAHCQNACDSASVHNVTSNVTINWSMVCTSDNRQA